MAWLRIYDEEHQEIANWHSDTDNVMDVSPRSGQLIETNDGVRRRIIKVVWDTTQSLEVLVYTRLSTKETRTP